MKRLLLGLLRLAFGLTLAPLLGVGDDFPPYGNRGGWL